GRGSWAPAARGAGGRSETLPLSSPAASRPTEPPAGVSAPPLSLRPSQPAPAPSTPPASRRSASSGTALRGPPGSPLLRPAPSPFVPQAPSESERES
ncbi:hypothetical protein P7K49_014640, partial [Saguinus oedipus]